MADLDSRNNRPSQYPIRDIKVRKVFMRKRFWWWSSSRSPVDNAMSERSDAVEHGIDEAQIGERLIADANAYRDASQAAAAAPLYHAALVYFPDRIDIRVQLGNMLKDSGALAQAETVYLEALAAAPHDADILLQLGHALKLSGRFEEALASYRRAVGLDSDSPAGREIAILEASLAHSDWRGVANEPRVNEFADNLKEPISSDAPDDEVELIESSGLFDTKFYLEQLASQALAGLQPLQHYILKGARQGFDPNPFFMSRWYLDTYPDVAENPLVEYLRQGADRGRSPSLEFDGGWYLDYHKDVAAAGQNPLIHYVLHGRAEGRERMPLKRQSAGGDTAELLKRLLPGAVAEEPYQSWLRANNLSEADIAGLTAALELRRGRLPKISVVMPVYNSDEFLLREAVASVTAQVYPNWELCIVDDGSTASHMATLLADIAANDGRIRVERSEKNGGISEATNSAVKIATGEIVAFCDHDDVLTPDCLAEIAIYYADHPDADLVYSDDDKIDMLGARFAPQFKPDYSPLLLLSYMYMGHILTVRTELFRSLGGFRRKFDGSQDFDFALRASEQARHVGHIPKVLYSWRVAPGSTAASGDAKPASFEAGRQAVSEALARRGVAGEAVHPAWAVDAKCGIFSIGYPDFGPKVTIVIPTKNGIDLLRACLSSIERTTYQNYDVMVVDNDSDDPDAISYLAEIASLPRIRVERISNEGRSFSFARVNNDAARRVTTEFVLFLNNDTEVRDPSWLSRMMGCAQHRGVGAVGAKLLFPDGTIQHAGIIHGLYNGLAGPAFRGQPASDWGYLAYAKVDREYSAVTAACLLMRVSVFLELGGFDEKRFAVAYNDVDLCYRIMDSGLSCIYASGAELVHHEGKTRGSKDDPREISAFRTKFAGRSDRYFNRNLSLENEGFSVRAFRFASAARRPIKTVMISHNLQHEGAPNSMLELVTGLKRRGVLDPIVFAPCEGPLRAEYEAAGVPVEIIRSPISGVQTDDDFRTAIQLFAEALLLHQPQVVYGNTLETFWAVSAGQEAGIPTIWNPRESEPWGSYFDYLPPDVRKRAYAAFLQAYAVVFVANSTRENWASVNLHNNARVIRNGINLERMAARMAKWTRAAARGLLSIADDQVVIVLVGTVCERKGQIDLVRAAGCMDPEIVRRCRIYIVGDRPGAYSSALRAEIGRLPAQIRESIVVVPETSDPYRYFRAADIAVCASRIESYPRVILEAMACGLPIVTTPVFGIAEQVREGVNAFFYQPADHAELAKKLARLAEDSKGREKMARASAHVLAGLTSHDEMLDSYAEVFREAAAYAAPKGASQCAA